MIKTMLAARPVRWAAIVLLHLATAALLLGPPIWNGTSSFFAYGHDALEQSYAWMQVLSSALHKGYLPLWDPLVQGGHSFVGEIQSGVFYPVNLLVAWLFGTESGISVQVLDVWIAVHFVIASLGFYWLCREVGCGRVAAFGGAFLFAYFGPVAFRAPAQVGIFFGLVWMPYAVAFAWRFLRSEKLREMFACGVVIGVQIVAGHIQPAFHTVILIASLVIYWRWQGGWRQYFGKRWLTAASLFAGGVALIALPQLLLAVQYLGDSYRWVSAGDYIGPWERVPFHVFLNRHILTPSSLLSIFNPWQYDADDGNVLYIGLPAAALCLAYFVCRFSGEELSSSSRLRPWLLGVMIFALSMALGSYWFFAVLVYPLPLITVVRELGRYAILIHFGLALAFAFGIDGLVRSGRLSTSIRAWPRWLIAFCVCYALWIFFYKHGPVIRPVAVQVVLLAAAVLALRFLPSLAWPVIFVGVAICTYTARDFYLPTYADGRRPPATFFVDSPILQLVRGSAEPGRVLIGKDEDLPQNYGIVAGIETKYGYAATYYRPYFDFLQQDWSTHSRVNDLLNIKWVISRKPQDLPLVMRDPQTGLSLYERPSAFPRAWLASDTTAIWSGGKPKRSVTWQQRAAQQLSLKVVTDGADELILSEVAYPGWRATVDGKDVPVRRVGVGGTKPLFRAVTLDAAGSHDVVFSYQPWRYFF